VSKIGPNSTHSPPAHRNTSAGVVTAFRSDRRSVNANVNASADASVNEKAPETLANSNQSVDMHALEQRIKQLPEVDTARVVELHTRIMASEYEVDSARLAGKLLDLESSFEF
jgi:negative regulator of flagellin synthesis FlgM